MIAQNVTLSNTQEGKMQKQNNIWNPWLGLISLSENGPRSTIIITIKRTDDRQITLTLIRLLHRFSKTFVTVINSHDHDYTPGLLLACYEAVCGSKWGFNYDIF